MSVFESIKCDCCGKVANGSKADRFYRLEKGWIEIHEYIDNDIKAWDICPDCAVSVFKAAGRKYEVFGE